MESPVNSCTFLLKDIPTPEDALLTGDVRKKKACQETSFEETRPKHLSDSSGLRIWTREENSAMKSDIEEVRKFGEGMMLESDYLYEIYNVFVEKKHPGGKFRRRVHNPSDAVAFQYIQIPKTGSTSMKIAFYSSFRSKEDLSPMVKQFNTTYTTIRHPIRRFLSGIGTLTFANDFGCPPSKVDSDPYWKAACDDTKNFTTLLNVSQPSRRMLEEALLKGLLFLERWSVFPYFTFQTGIFFNHVPSQMYFYNMAPSPLTTDSKIPAEAYQV